MNNWSEENTAEPLKDYENRVQLTSISVRTKGEKQAGTIQISKYVVYISVSKCWSEKYQISRIENLPKTLNDLVWHFCLSKFYLTKYDLDSLIYYFHHRNMLQQRNLWKVKIHQKQKCD